MPLNDDALTTVGAITNYLKVTDDDSVPPDLWLEQLINGVSAEVQSYTGRKYRPYTGIEITKTFSHDGSAVCEIDDASIVSKVSIQLPGWATAVELDESLYVGEPVDHPDSPNIVTRIRFFYPEQLVSVNSGWAFGNQQSSSWTQWPREARASSHIYMGVDVLGEWGWETVPANVELAVHMWIQNIIKRDAAYFSSEFADGKFIEPGAMPKDVAQILDGQCEQRLSVAAV